MNQVQSAKLESLDKISGLAFGAQWWPPVGLVLRFAANARMSVVRTRAGSKEAPDTAQVEAISLLDFRAAPSTNMLPPVKKHSSAPLLAMMVLRSMK